MGSDFPLFQRRSLRERLVARLGWLFGSKVDDETVTLGTARRRVVLKADASSLAWLVIEGPREAESRQYTLQQMSATIGRGVEAEIMLPDSHASRRHSEIRFEGGEFYIYDLGSTNATILNDAPIERALLHDNDVIVVGDTRLTFRVTWHEWLSCIEAFLQNNEVVTADMLVDVPSSYRFSILMRYAREHADQALVMDADQQMLCLERAEQVRALRAKWQAIEAESGDFSGGKLEDDPRRTFIESFCDHLGIGWKPVGNDKLVVGYELDTSVAFQNTRLPVPLPLICLAQDELGEPMAQTVRHFLVRNFGGSSRIALMLSFAQYPNAPAHANIRLQDQIKGAYACDIIVIGKAEIDRLAQAKDAQARLRKILLSHVDLKTVSPFIITGPVAPHIFFGREDILRTVVEHAHDRSFILVGGRRIGKSSILTRLYSVALPEMGFCTVFHDCSTTPSYDSLLLAPVHDCRPTSSVELAKHSTMGSLLQTDTGSQPLVLLLDEADKLIPSEQSNGWRLFSMLRALNNAGRIRFVLAGERALQESLQNSRSPLFNLANEILISRLEREAVRELVVTPMRQLEIELQAEDSIVERIYDFTSGHPNIVQRLCHRLIMQLNEQEGRFITLEDVDRVIEDPGFQSDDFLSTYWETATPLERLISLLMADDAGLHTLADIRQVLAVRCHLQPKAGQVSQALDRLVKLRSLLKRTSGGYEFAVSAFPRVVAGTMTLSDAVEVEMEEYQEQQE